MKTPMDKLPNEGLQELVKSGEKGKQAVERMGFEHGGMVKAERCPHRDAPVETAHTPASVTGIKGAGAAVKGVGFKGIF